MEFAAAATDEPVGKDGGERELMKRAGDSYNNASEVVRDGLRELQRRKHADQLTEIRARIGAGLDQLDRGEGRSGEPAAVLGGILEEAKLRHRDR